MSEIKNVFVPIPKDRKSLLEEIKNRLVTTLTEENKQFLSLPTPASKLEIVGACTICGNPIFGCKTILSTVSNPEVKRSCDCLSRKSFEDTVRTT